MYKLLQWAETLAINFPMAFCGKYLFPVFGSVLVCTLCRNRNSNKDNQRLIKYIVIKWLGSLSGIVSFWIGWL